jgi:hypothetical protein
MLWTMAEELNPLQIDLYRRMSFREKYRLSLGLARLARQTRLAAYRRNHPEWPESKLHQAVAREFARSRT